MDVAALGRTIASKAIEGALQNEGGGVLVHDLGAAGTAHVLGNERPLDGGTREPLVP